MKPFDIVVATDLGRGIGKDGVMPWDLPEDLKYFRQLTATAELGKQNVVIMGRRTWNSIPEAFRPLPGRINVVITSLPTSFFLESVIAFPSLELALEWVQCQGEVDQCFVVGGGQLYGEAIRHPWLERLYITQIQHLFECDTFFPEYENDFVLEEPGVVQTSRTGWGYRMTSFVRKVA